MAEQLLTVPGVYDGKAIKPLARLKTNKKQRVLIIFLDAIEAPAERKKTSAAQRRKSTARGKKAELLAEREDWRQLALRSLERAYGDDEPEYSSALIKERNPDYATSDLLSPSVIRLGFLSAIPRKDIEGMIGRISPTRHRRLLKTLSNYLIGKK